MEEENRVVEQEQPQGMTPNCKKALIALILAVGGVGIGFGWLVGGIAGIVLGLVSLSFLGKIEGEVERQPFRTFSKIAKPVAIVAIIVSAIMFVIYLIYFIIWIVAVVAAAAEAASEIALFLL